MSSMVKMKNRDALAALRALRTLAKERGFPDQEAAYTVGRNIRRLQVVADEHEDARSILIQAHAKTDDTGRPIESAAGAGGGIMLATPSEFIGELRKLDAKEIEVEVFPIDIVHLGQGDGKGKTLKCSKCKMETGLPVPEDFAALLDLGYFVKKE